MSFMPTKKAFGNEPPLEHQYISLLQKCMKEGYIGKNNRTNSQVESLIGERIAINDSDRLPLLQSRKMFIKTSAAELAWTILGEKSTEFMRQYSRIWDKFEVNGEVTTAYGYRWRKHFERDQLKEVIDHLKKDSTSRQAVVMAWDPSQDGLSNSGKDKNIPCPMGFQVSIAGNMLHINVYQRSADLILGLPYDMLMYSMLNCAMSKELLVLPGKTIFNIGNAHIYDYVRDVAVKQCQIFEDNKYDILHDYYSSQGYTIPEIQWIETWPGAFVHLMVEQAAKKYFPLWTSRKLEPIQ